MQRTQWDQILKVNALSLRLKYITDRNDNLKTCRWPPLSHLPRTVTMESHSLSTSCSWSDVDNLEASDERCCRQQTDKAAMWFPFHFWSTCILAVCASWVQKDHTDGAVCRSFTWPLLTPSIWKNSKVNTISLSNYDFSHGVWANKRNCKPLLTQINACIELKLLLFFKIYMYMYDFLSDFYSVLDHPFFQSSWSLGT